MIHFRLGGLPSDELDRELQRFLDHYQRRRRPLIEFTQSIWRPLADVYETPDMVVALIELAGVDQEHTEIVVEDLTLTVRGNRLEQVSREPRSYHVMEIKIGRFERVISLPAKVDAERTTAQFRDGILEILLPKATEAPVSIKISVSESESGS